MNIATFFCLSIAFVLAAGCVTTQPLPIDTPAQPDIEVRYDHGQPVLDSKKINRVTVMLLGAAEDAVVFDIAWHNLGQEDFTVSTENVELTLASVNAPAQPAKVFSYEELAAGDDDSLLWDSASIASGAVLPAVIGGGAVGAVVKGVIDLGMGEARNEASAQADSAALARTYLRKHTLLPETSYNGVVKIGLPRRPAANDILLLTVTTPADSHRFQFLIKS